uniref:Gamma-glutamylcyclotransferase family protein n=1 Tax=Macrostomum lignano TaxID=282301 RepID=A0A1I8IZ01_9PLAT
KHLVFVYGTLKRDNFNHRLLTDAEFIGTAVTKEPLSSGDCQSGHRVTGEVYNVNSEQLKNLDYLEMHPHVYERREMIVNLTQSSAAVDTSCLSYFLVRSLPKLLELPHLDCFVDGVNGRWYVNPQLRTGEPFRFEVQLPPEGTQEEVEAWKKL